MIDDPFFAIRKDAEDHLKEAIGLLLSIERMNNVPTKIEFTSYKAKEAQLLEQLDNVLDTLQWELDDLAEAVSAVQVDPKKFNLTLAEVNSRKQFVSKSLELLDLYKNRCREARNVMQRRLLFDTNNHIGVANSGQGSNNYTLDRTSNDIDTLTDDEEYDNQLFIDNVLKKQQKIMEGQDSNLDSVGEVVGRLREMGIEMGNEIDNQNILLDDMSTKMSKTESRLQSVQNKITKILDSASDRFQYITIAVLLVVLVVLVILFIFL